MQLRAILIVTFAFTNLMVSAQNNFFYVDSSFRCKKIIATDTIVYRYTDSLNQPKEFSFPVNSKINFHSNIENFELHTTSAEIRNDSIIIYFTKQSYGLSIEVIITKIHNNIKTDIWYSTIIGGTVRLTNKKTSLMLQQSNYSDNERLIGKIDIDFYGSVDNPVIMAKEKIEGKIEGCFNVPISKILKSRFNQQ